MRSVRFYRPLKNVGIRSSIIGDTTVDGIVVWMIRLSTQYEICSSGTSIKILHLFSDYYWILHYNSDFTGNHEEFCTFCADWCLKVTTITKNNFTLNSSIFSLQNRLPPILVRSQSSTRSVRFFLFLSGISKTDFWRMRTIYSYLKLPTCVEVADTID